MEQRPVMDKWAAIRADERGGQFATDRSYDNAPCWWLATVCLDDVHHCIVAAHGAFYDRNVDDVVVVGPSRQGPHGSDLNPGEVLNVASLEQPRQVCLWTASPALR